jgi:hypothetical protein
MLQELEFNTTEKTVKLRHYPTNYFEPIIHKQFNNIKTVRIDPAGYYELMQVFGEATIPVYRAPIASTNMLLIK